MSPAERLLERLEGAKSCGPGRWMARCPAHEDRGPSLSVRELDDGRLLLHCFAQCETGDVLAAVGLSLGDLFPEPLAHNKPAARDYRHTHAAREALKLVDFESLLVAIAAEHMAAGRALTVEDRSRLRDAALRIRAAREVAA